MPDISGVVLAGGQSRRLGTNKAFLKLGQKSLIERAVSTLGEIFQEVLVITNQTIPNLPQKVRVLPDIFPGKGSLGGLYTGLINSMHSHIFAVACDMPFLDPKFIRFMLTDFTPWDIVIPRDQEGYQPLHAIYSRNCIPYIEKQLTQGRLAIIEFFNLVKLNVIEGEKLEMFNKNGLTFFNINTLEDWQKAQLVASHMKEERFI
ncbi:MAG: molybdenum cofactor guanylyltransferase [Candidatus Tectomicrobia bacterium]|uniref:Probable molybdenum cofactor guanylyltransferase n=1 Tax=Tectimicrobiota bacterium TaxID=2528274 RepID=A0A933GM13_UNCTE|nr:molybdenum cofactor guanylyltransferase [Candidatus Tectomicrobia bacterium]